MSDENRDEEFEAWLATRPPAVAAAVRAHPPESCYRMSGSAGHYMIYSYGEPANGGPITVTLIHGTDSTLPGVSVFGIDPSTLTPCGCGNLEWPRPEQIEKTKKRITAISN